jgi:hypothetical protein
MIISGKMFTAVKRLTMQMFLRHAKIQAKTKHNCHPRSNAKIMYKLRRVVLVNWSTAYLSILLNCSESGSLNKLEFSTATDWFLS